MSNIFIKGTAPFYSVPQHLVDSGKLRSLSEGAHKLYQFILFKAQKHSRPVLELSNREIREAVGLSPNTIRRGRTELWEAGLVRYKRDRGERFTYVVLNPLAISRPLPGAEPKSGGGPPLTPAAETLSPSWEALSK